MDVTTKNGLNILSLCGREDIPLYRGSAVAVDQKQPATVSAFGDDGLGGFADTILSTKREEKENAVDFLTEYVDAHPGEITLFALGPCTNIALAIRKSKSFASNLKSLIIMGGAKYTGNMSPLQVDLSFLPKQWFVSMTICSLRISICLINYSFCFFESGSIVKWAFFKTFITFASKIYRYIFIYL